LTAIQQTKFGTQTDKRQSKLALEHFKNPSAVTALGFRSFIGLLGLVCQLFLRALPAASLNHICQRLGLISGFRSRSCVRVRLRRRFLHDVLPLLLSGGRLVSLRKVVAWS
jgi:hypothetical protein